MVNYRFPAHAVLSTADVVPRDAGVGMIVHPYPTNRGRPSAQGAPTQDLVG